MGVLVFCIGVGPLGFLQLGLLADWWNASAAVTIVAIEGLIALAIVMLRYPELRRAIAPSEKN